MDWPFKFLSKIQQAYCPTYFVFHYAIDGIQYSGATVAFLAPPTFLCSYGVLLGNSDFLMFKHLKLFLNG